MKFGQIRKRCCFLVWWFAMTLLFCILLGGCSESEQKTFVVRRSLRETKITQSHTSNHVVKLNEEDNQLVVDNGVVRVTLSVPEGNVVGVSYNGMDNLLDASKEQIDRGYFDVVWNEPEGQGTTGRAPVHRRSRGRARRRGRDRIGSRIEGTNFSVIAVEENLLEVSFLKTWTPSMKGSSVPINIDKRYVFRSGDSGFYSYIIFDRPEGFPAVEVDQIRTVFKLDPNIFNYMALTDSRQRRMPTMEDRERGQALAYPEAVLLTNPINPEFRGEVDDKYQYSIENQDNRVHGWISLDSDSPVGFWMITPSNEFRNCGPVKQDLTSHVGPITLSMFVSTHYAGKEVTMAFEEGETYKKVFGPVFVYLNSVSAQNDSLALWSDAVQKMTEETNSWPYDFPRSQDFFPPDQRGTVTGRLLVQDWFIKGGRFLNADSAYVGLALPGDAGSWQRESKGYQFWTRANEKGNFVIENAVPGDYNLYAWVPGFIGDYRYNATITITPGGAIQLGRLVYSPPRNGPTIWEIGVPDRSAAEFYIPEPYTTLMNHLYNGSLSQDRFRQYGLWERYADLYPENDLVYTVGVDDYHKDWFYAHVTRNTEYNKTYKPTTWQIVFELQREPITGNYTLQLALASAANAEIQLRINDPESSPPPFTTGSIGGDNAIARHGIHGLYWLYSIGLPSDRFVKGKNIIFLKQSKASNQYQGVMYDYIRLEKPPTSAPRT